MVVLTPDPELLPAPAANTVVFPGVEVDERAARRTLRDQIAHLEAEIAAALATPYPRLAPLDPVQGFAGPRMLGLAELERTRDELAARLYELRARTSEQADRQESKRLLIEQMLVDPARFKWVRVSGEDIGEHAC